MGPLSLHMATHIALMNGLAPLLVMSLLRLRLSQPSGVGRNLIWATALQLLLLWGWHAPPLLNQAMQVYPIHLLMQASLFLSGLYFWWAVLASRASRRWRPILALLLTSKLFCLLGVLLVFSPRALYRVLPEHSHGPVATVHEMLADQQLAGLMMLVACPASYVVGGIIIAHNWLSGLHRDREDILPSASREIR